MCGRYVMQQTLDDLVAQFDAGEVTPGALAADRPLTPRYNVAPTQHVPVVVAKDSGERVLDAFQWGLIPFWAKDTSIGSKMINARAETVAEKPSFRDSFKKRRCIIPASGFYEWDKVGAIGKLKQPYYFSPAIGSGESAPAWAFAGLWASWGPRNANPHSDPLLSCSIITTAANKTVGQIHERMPVILDAGGIDLWLDPTITDADVLGRLLQPYPDDRMRVFAVSKAVNAVVNGDSGLIEPVVNSA